MSCGTKRFVTSAAIRPDDMSIWETQRLNKKIQVPYQAYISFIDIQITIHPCHMINHRHVGRPPLRSYLTTDMEDTRKGKACTAVTETAMQLDVNWMKMICGLEQGIITNTYKRDTAQNNTMAENIVISCSLVLLLVSKTEKIGPMTAHNHLPRPWSWFQEWQTQPPPATLERPP